MDAAAGAKGAASGAMAGAALGPWGAAAGGVIGGALGLFSGGDQDKFKASNPYSLGVLQGAVDNGGTLYSQQQLLARQLAAQGLGQGPNPALEQLHQTTDQNNQLAAGLVASQRGLNPALAARMGLQAQATSNQTAAGQAATLGAQQQLASQGQLSGLLGNMSTQQLQQQQLYTNAGASADKLNAGVSAENTATNVKTNAGLMQGAGALGAMMLKSPSDTPSTLGSNNAPGSSPGLGVNTSMSSVPAVNLSTGGQVPGHAAVAGDSQKNDTVKAKLSPGEIVIPRSHADNAADAKAFIDALMSKKKKTAGPQGYAAVIAAHRELGKALEAVK